MSLKSSTEAHRITIQTLFLFAQFYKVNKKFFTFVKNDDILRPETHTQGKALRIKPSGQAYCTIAKEETSDF